MIRRSLLVWALTLVGATAYQTSAFAEDQTVEFSGTVAATCTFSNTQAGTLAVDSSDNTNLSSAATGGTNGSTTVTCNSGADITAGTPTASGPAATDLGGSLTAQVIDTSGTPVTSVTTNTATPLNVALTVDSNNPIPAGNYNYSVTLTATPN